MTLITIEDYTTNNGDTPNNDKATLYRLLVVSIVVVVSVVGCLFLYFKRIKHVDKQETLDAYTTIA